LTVFPVRTVQKIEGIIGVVGPHLNQEREREADPETWTVKESIAPGKCRAQQNRNDRRRQRLRPRRQNPGAQPVS